METGNFIFIAYASVLSAYIPIVVRVLTRKEGFSTYDNLILLSIASFATDVICFVYYNKKENNWPFINLFLIFQIIMIFLIFYSYNKKRWAIIFLFFFILYAGYNYYWYYDKNSIITSTEYIGSAFLIAFAFDCIDKVMVELPVKNLYDHHIFWMFGGVLLYFTGNFLPFLFNNEFSELSLMDYRAHWVLHNFLNISKNVCFAFAVWMNYRMGLS